MGKLRRYHPQFVSDLSLATTYYDSISTQLGNRFRELVRHKLDRILEEPELYGRIREDVRAAMVDRFPYVILYEVRNDFVLMLGIHHAASDRSGWFERETD